MKLKWLEKSSVMLLACVLFAAASDARGAVVYYVGNAGTTGDTNLVAHLQNDLGHTVVFVDHYSAHSYGAAVAADAELILLSGSMSSSAASGRGYATSRIPVLNFEAFSYDNFGWTGDVQNTDFGDSATGQDTIQIDNASHSITSGFSAGPLAVLSDAAEDSRFSFGLPGADADVLATYQGGGTGNGAATIFVYEKGDNLVDPTDDNPAIDTARSRYIGFFLDYGAGVPDLHAKMNANGVQLFDQAVSYALAQPVSETELIAHWTFDDADQLADTAGDNDGTAVGGAAVTTETAAVGTGSLKLTKASGQYVTIDGLADEGLSTYDDVTVTMWVKTTRGSGDMADLTDNIAISAHTADKGNVLRMGTGVDGGVYLNPTDIGGVDPNEENGSGLNDGQWHFVAMTLEGDGTSTVWADNGAGGLAEVEGFTDRMGQPKWSDAACFTLGQEWDSTTATNFFDGNLDDVRIYSGALTLDALTDLYELANELPDLQGDLNGDGFVGGDDLDIVRSFWGQSVPLGDLESGDPSKDGFVGGDDLDIVRANWGQGSPPAPTAVPEPSVLALLAVGALCLLARRR